MISIDSSIVWAILIFLSVVAALNYLLFQPLLRVQEERQSRTSGLVERSRKQLDHYLDLFNRYQASIKNGRMEGYKRQEELRSEAMKKRAEALEQARRKSGQLIEESRESIRQQAKDAGERLEHDADEIARGIAASILRRPA